ncbi:PAS domain-containing sensor histidine kinase [Desulforhabdus sp. TSK]|uniref:PAS domain-containing sensor histidine kinase n=1 Tax=Desulforhabdus sp. TSK TaxID=2925014 RepID=UPI001FC82A1F|nr:PAS domain-containing sensor histidine kinase [Desulforhabdus sp. TSK]GKT10448.1 hypothetical protein DSTSK_37530 [Desulforhabdus sp. TSK]
MIPRNPLRPGNEDTSGSETTRYKSFFESFPHIMFVAAADGRLIEVNEAGAELFYHACREDMSKTCSMASFFRNAEDWHLLWQRIEAEGFIKDVEVEMQRKDGSYLTSSVTARLRTEPDGTLVCDGLVRDVTERRHCLQALEESESRILKMNDHMLNMLMIMSHDLRGPLISMGAGLKLLVRGSFGAMEERVARTLNGLMSQAVRLHGIVEDCLSRAVAVEGFHGMQKESLDLRKEIIDPVLEELADEIQAAGVTIDNRLGSVPAGAVSLHAGRRWLKSVYRNLFRNAVQYGGKGCTIAFGYEDQGDRYRLNVYNTGEPVSEEHREKLFTKFDRIGAEDSSQGVGLGLYLVKEIIRRHGGDIWYEADRTGSNFVFTICKEKEDVF